MTTFIALGIILGGLLLWGVPLLILVVGRFGGRVLSSIIVNVAGSLALIVGGAAF